MSNGTATDSRAKILVRLLLFLGLLGLSLAIGAGFLLRHVWDKTRVFTHEVEQASYILQQTNRANAPSALTQAKQHLSNADHELAELAPFVAPMMTLSEWTGLLGDQPRVLWNFAQLNTQLAHTVLDGAILAEQQYRTDKLQGLEQVKPELLTTLEQATQLLSKAQQLRSQLNTTVLPTDLAQKVDPALAQWDSQLAPLREQLPRITQNLAVVNLEENWQQVKSLQSEITKAKRVIEDESLDELERILQVKPHLLSAQAQFEALNPAVIPMLGLAQSYNQLTQQTALSTQNVEAWWLFAHHVTSLGAEVAIAADFSHAALEQNDIPAFLEILPSLAPHLRQAQLDFEQAQRLRTQLDSDIPSIIPAEYHPLLNNALAYWDEYEPILSKTVPEAGGLVEALPILLGQNKPMTYLMLIQNSDDLQATGGFIGGIGIITVDQGNVTEINLGDTVDFNNYVEQENGGVVRRIIPPEPLTRYMGIGGWYMFNANWWADFPRTAQQMVEMWQLRNDTPIDGVIGLNDQSLMRFLETIGQVQTLDGTVLDSQNVLDFVTRRLYGEQFFDGETPAQTTLLHELAVAY